MKKECAECGQKYKDGNIYFCNKCLIKLKEKGWKERKDGLLTKGDINSKVESEEMNV